MKIASSKWAYVLCVIIIVSGMLQVSFLNVAKQSVTISEKSSQITEQKIMGIEEEQPNGRLLTVENDTHYQNLTDIKNWESAYYHEINDLAVVGNTTYLATNMGLIIYNTTDPTLPALISQTFHNGRHGIISVENDLVYVESGYGNSLTIINCSDLLNPIPINDIWFNNVLDFVIDGDIAFISTNNEFCGLQIYNLSDLLNPIKISENNVLETETYQCIQKQDDYLYCLSYPILFEIFNVSNLETPLLMISEILQDSYFEFVVKNNYLFFLGYNSFQIMYLSPTYSLYTSDTIELAVGQGFTIHNNRAYIVCTGYWPPQFQIYDITDPYSITLLTSREYLIAQENAYRYKIHVEGKIATVTCGSKGFVLLNISDYSNVTRLSYEFSGYIIGITVFDDFAIVSFEYNGIKILNISDIQNPRIVATLFIEGLYGRLVYENSLLYFFTRFTSRFFIFNMSNPLSPTKISHYESSSHFISEIFIGVGVAILVANDHYLIVDISNPNNPTLLHHSDTYDYMRDMTLYNDSLFIAYGPSDNYYFDTVNITNPLSPETINQVSLAKRPRMIRSNGTCLFVFVSFTYEFYIFNTTDIANPILVSQTILPFSLSQCLIRDNLLYLFNSQTGLEIREVDAQYNLILYGELSPTPYLFLNLIDGSGINDDLIFMTFYNQIVVVGFDNDDDAVADFLEINVYGTDPFDSDSDNDLMSDGYEIEFNLDPLNGTDADLDYDGDTLTNYDESLIYTDPWSNDTDADSLTDNLEVFYGTDPLNPDTDYDMLLDFEEIFDYSTDPLEYDSDGDSLMDGHEVLVHQTDPLDNDTDDDLMTDGFEVNFGLDPHFDDAFLDLDLDGLTNFEEFLLGTYPNRSDSDSDGYSDLEEIEAGTDPLDYLSFPDYPLHPVSTDPLSWSGFFATILIVFSISVFWMRKRYINSWEMKTK